MGVSGRGEQRSALWLGQVSLPVLHLGSVTEACPFSVALYLNIGDLTIFYTLVGLHNNLIQIAKSFHGTVLEHMGELFKVDTVTHRVPLSLS